MPFVLSTCWATVSKRRKSAATKKRIFFICMLFIFHERQERRRLLDVPDRGSNARFCGAGKGVGQCSLWASAPPLVMFHDGKDRHFCRESQMFALINQHFNLRVHFGRSVQKCINRALARWEGYLLMPYSLCINTHLLTDFFYTR